MKIIKEDIENLERYIGNAKVGVHTDLPIVMADAYEDSKKRQEEIDKELEAANKVPELEKVIGAEKQPVPKLPEEAKVNLEESLFEDYDADVRHYSDMLFDLIEQGAVDAADIAKDLIYWCSEDDIKRYMEVNMMTSEFMNDEEDEEIEEGLTRIDDDLFQEIDKYVSQYGRDFPRKFDDQVALVSKVFNISKEKANDALLKRIQNFMDKQEAAWKEVSRKGNKIFYSQIPISVVVDKDELQSMKGDAKHALEDIYKVEEDPTNVVKYELDDDYNLIILTFKDGSKKCWSIDRGYSEVDNFIDDLNEPLSDEEVKKGLREDTEEDKYYAALDIPKGPERKKVAAERRKEFLDKHDLEDRAQEWKAAKGKDDPEEEEDLFTRINDELFPYDMEIVKTFTKLPDVPASKRYHDGDIGVDYDGNVLVYADEDEDFDFANQVAQAYGLEITEPKQTGKHKVVRITIPQD